MKFSPLPVALYLMWAAHGSAQVPKPYEELNIYAGNTHAHTIYTMSHGSHLGRPPDFVKGSKILEIDALHLSRPINYLIKPDWEKYQGTPQDHFALAAQSDFDFYCVTDHSQEAAFYPNDPLNIAWILSQKHAEKATTDTFTGLIGYEHSENDGPGGKGHYNVIGSSRYLNALDPGVDVASFYTWLKANPINLTTGDPVAVTFNHPGPEQYDNWKFRDAEITDIITMLEVINGTQPSYEGFISALDKGWKVSPVAGLDNHGTGGIKEIEARTFVVAARNTRSDILRAMRMRRTYAASDKNLECRYTVNGHMAGADIPSAATYTFEVYINDPDTSDPADTITKIEIIGSGGALIDTFIPATKSHRVRCRMEVSGSENPSAYYFLKIWDNSADPAGAAAESDLPVATLAPVWITR